MKVSVKPQDGKIVEKVINLTSVTIGRSRSCDFPIEDEALSRKHSQIDLENGEFFITDLGSANGVYIDGNKIPPLTRTKISSFQIIYMGPLEFQFFDTDEAPAHSPREAKTNPIMRRQDEPTISQPTRRIDRSVLGKPSSRKPKSEDTKTPIGLYLSAGLIVAVIFGFYRNFTNTPSDTENFKRESLPVVAEVIEPVKKAPIAPEEFLEKTIYLQRRESANCQTPFESLCKELHLIDQDGIVKLLDEYFIFVNPTHYSELKGFQSLSDIPLAKDAAAVYQILRNPITDQLGKELSQVHLILFDDAGSLYRVYRFHPNTLKEAKIDILTSIGSGVSSGNFEGFSNISKQFIPSKDY